MVPICMPSDGATADRALSSVHPCVHPSCWRPVRLGGRRSSCPTRLARRRLAVPLQGQVCAGHGAAQGPGAGGAQGGRLVRRRGHRHQGPRVQVCQALSGLLRRAKGGAAPSMQPNCALILQSPVAVARRSPSSCMLRLQLLLPRFPMLPALPPLPSAPCFAHRGTRCTCTTSQLQEAP